MSTETTLLDSVASSISSASAASSASAVSSASAASVAAAAAAAAASASASASQTATAGLAQPSFTTGPNGSRTPVTPGQPTATGPNPSGSGTPGNPGGPGTVQSGGGGSNFPHWAIAVIVVLGFFALLASGMLAFFIVRRIRARQGGTLSHRGSMGSSTPMMANAQANSPLLEPGAGFGAAAGAGLVGAAALNRPQTPLDAHDGASTTSRASDAAFLSSTDAAIMADAFRKALRKPDFADRPVEEGESPDNGNGGAGTGELINQELAEEGRDIRSVNSSRGFRVEAMSDEEDTIQDNPH